MREFSSFWDELKGFKKPEKVKIGFSDFDDIRVQTAAKQLESEGVIEPILLYPPGIEKPSNLYSTTEELVKDAGYLLQRKNNLFPTREAAEKTIVNDMLFAGLAALNAGRIDGLVSGSLRPTAEVIKGALACVGPQEGKKFVFGQFLAETTHLKTKDNTPFLLADCAVVPQPSARVLAQTALDGGDAYHFFTHQTPKIALLSFSTRGSAEHKTVENIRNALKIAKNQLKIGEIDGEIQLDAALDLDVAQIKKAEDSPLRGAANTLIFPNLESGNIGYKLIQRFSNARIAGPILWGLAKPMSDLSRGCTVDEIVQTAYCVRKMVLKGR